MPVPCPTAPRRPTLAAALIGLLAVVGPAQAADPPLLYLTADAAIAVHDGVGGDTLRQARVIPNPRWPSARVVGKVTGHDLSTLSAEAIAARLRAGWRSDGASGLVSVDEITPRRWTAAAAGRLAAALDQLGGNAKRVMFYASPSFVEQVGRADPRAPLPGNLAALVDAVSRGRATYLLTYRGDRSPFPAREMATHPTRWAARWPAGRGELRLTLGADAGIGQAELWSRARSTPAGRAMLANGPGAYGLGDAAAGRAWAEQYRAFRANPSVSVSGGDFPVPGPGGLRLRVLGVGRVSIGLDRAGNSAVTMTPRGGGFVRTIRKLVGPTPRDVVITLPRDARPGLYVIRAALIGDGLRDRASVIARVPKRR